MMSEIYYGRIEPYKLASWSTGEEPYDILSEMIQIRCSGWDFLFAAYELLREKPQPNWFTIAYKANKSELEKLGEKMKVHIDGIETLEENVDYDVLFIDLD